MLQPTNTYQAILVADGTKTYAVFVYEEIGWTMSSTVVRDIDL